MSFFNKGDGHEINDFAFETIMNIDNNAFSFKNHYSNQSIEEYNKTLENLANNVNVDIDNQTIIDFNISRLESKILMLGLTTYSSNKNKILLSVLNSLNNKFLKRKELICKQIGIPSSEEELINSSHNKSTLELLKEIGFYDNLKKKHNSQNCLNIAVILGRDSSYSIEVIEVQTIYFSFCYYIGLIVYLEEYYAKIYNIGIENKIGQFLSEISNFATRDTCSNFRRYYLNRNDPNSRHFALKKANIEFVSGLIK